MWQSLIFHLHLLIMSKRGDSPWNCDCTAVQVLLFKMVFQLQTSSCHISCGCSAQQTENNKKILIIDFKKEERERAPTSIRSRKYDDEVGDNSCPPPAAFGTRERRQVTLTVRAGMGNGSLSDGELVWADNKYAVLIKAPVTHDPAGTMMSCDLRGPEVVLRGETRVANCLKG